MASATTVEQYLAALPDDARAVLEQLRQTIRAAAPKATETIAYDMPAFRSNGHFLVSYAAFKRHFSLFPANETAMAALGDELTPFFAGKATLRFTAANRIPSAVVTRLVQLRLAETAPPDGGKAS
jgi:uncharacterized protein YdhG (YjbR/CyaY superfamily)